MTLTLFNPTLARWKNISEEDGYTAEQVEAAAKYFAFTDWKQPIKVYYDIMPATNGWNVTPQMPGWSFNGFNAEVSFITSGLMFAGADVAYRLGLQNGAAVTWTDYFTVDENGIVSEGIEFDEDGVASVKLTKEQIINQLSMLKPGTYILQSRISDIKVKVGESEDGKDVLTTNVNGIEITTDNAGRPIATVKISKATNRWTRTPNIVRWIWDEYKIDRNKITATALYPTLLADFFAANNITSNPIQYQIVTYAENDDGTTSTTAIRDLSKDANDNDFWFTSVSTAVSEALKKLPAGSYALRAKLIGNDYYDDIEPLDIVFDIEQADNSWKISPNVVRWEWGSYKKEVNVISATPRFNETGIIHYTVLDSNYAPVANLVNFTAITESVETALKGLDAGDYYLITALEGGDNFRAINDWDEDVDDELKNVEGYTWGSAYDFADTDKNKRLSPTQFTVSVARNTWSSSPRLTGWQYTAFDATNFIAGVPTIAATGDSAAKVQYEIILDSATVTPTVDKNKPTNAEGKYYFELPANVEPTGNDLPEAIDAYLKTLTVAEAGRSYWLIAYYPGTNNYDELYVAASFTVSQATSNPWKTLPSITGWTYGVGGNFTEGEATFGNAGTKYTVQKVTGENSYESVPGYVDLTVAQLLNSIKNLSADDYQLVVISGSSDDYVAATRELNFKVTKASNSWNVAPTMSGWTWTGSVDDQKSPVIADNAVAHVEEDEDGNDINVVSSEYYKAVLNVSDWVKSGEALNKNTVLAAGNYICEFTVPASANYQALTHSVYFEVSQDKEGAWTVNPSGWITWKWGESATAIPDNFRNPVATMPPETDQEIKYEVRRSNGSDTTSVIARTTKGDENFDQVFAGLGVGNYTVTVYVQDSENYVGATATMNITVTAANFNWDTEPEGAEWQWNVSGSKTITKPILGGVIDGDTEGEDYTVKYHVENTKTNEGNEYTSYDAMLAALKLRQAGKYNITYTASGANYNELSATVELVIKEGTFKWTTPPQNASWAWGDTTKTIVEPVAAIEQENADVATFVVKYSIAGVPAMQNVEFSTLEEYLTNTDRTEATYNVTASVSLANYETLSDEFTVDISTAVNEWKTAPKDISRNYEESLAVSGITEPEPMRGTVQYSVGAAKYDTLNELLDGYINSGLNAGTYNITVTVAAKVGCYTGLNGTIKLTVFGAGGSWDNIKELIAAKDDNGAASSDNEKAKYNFTFSDDLETSLKNVLIPTKAQYKDVTAEWTYTVQKSGEVTSANFRTKVPADATGLPAQVTAYLVENVNSGVYTVTAVYKPDNDNYATLTYTITIQVGRATIVWDEDTLPDALNGEYRSRYGEFTGISTPKTIGDYPITYRVTKADGTEVELPKDGITDLCEYINTLDVGDYYIYYSVEMTDTYNGLDEERIRVIVGKGVNSLAVTESEYTFERGDTIVLDAATVLHGAAHYIYDGVRYETIDALSMHFNAVEGKLLNGDYTYTVSVDDNPNYDSVSDLTVTVHVNKKSNGWIENSNGEVFNFDGVAAMNPLDATELDTNKFTVPEAEKYTVQIGNKQYDVRRFTIFNVRTNSNVVENVDVTKFAEEFVKLYDGTYDITVTVGSDGKDTDDAIAAYDVDYKMLSVQYRVVVTIIENGFTDEFDVEKNWKYGATDIYVPDPQAIYAPSQSTIVYSIVKIGATEDDKPQEFKGEGAYDEFVAAVRALTAGNYTVSAVIDASNTYKGASTSNVYTVSAADNGFVTGFTKTEWTYGAENISVPELTATYADSQADIVYIIDGEGEYNGEDAYDDFIAALKKLPAGTYVIRGRIDATAKHDRADTDTTVTVKRRPNALNDWAPTIDWNYYDDIVAEGEGDVVILNPICDDTVADSKATIVYTISGNGVNKEFKGPDTYGNFIAALKELTEGQYQLTASIEETGTYDGVRVSTTCTVSTAGNSFKTSLAIDQPWYVGSTATAADGDGDIKIVEPKAAYGGSTVIYTLTGTTYKGGVIATQTFTGTNDDGTAFERLVAYLNTYVGAGNYRITVRIPASATYGEKTETVDFEIKRRANAFDTAFEMPESWAFGDPITIVEPVATEGNAQISYLLTGNQDDETKTAVSQQFSGDNAFDSFEAFVKKLVAGNYKVTITIPSTDDYEDVSVVDYGFTVTRKINSCTTGLRDLKWNVGDTITAADGDGAVKIAMPVAVAGNDAIVYTVTNIDTNDTRKFEGKDAFANFLAHLRSLPAGSYNVHADIAVSLMYTETYTNAVYTIKVKDNDLVSNIVIPGWTFGDTVTAADGDGSVKIVAPEFDYGNDRIRFTLTGHDADGKSVKATFVKVDDEDDDAFTKLVDYLATLGAGNYEVVASVTATGEYAGETAAAVEFNIARKANSWKTSSLPTDNKWVFGSYVTGSVDFIAEHNDGDMIITLDGVAVGSMSELQTKLAALIVGDHTLVLTLNAKGNYGELNKTIGLSVTKSPNKFTGNLSIDASWTWDNGKNTITLTLPISDIGNITVLVEKKGVTEAAINATLNVTRNNGVDTLVTEQVTALESRLRNLGVGEYTMTVSVAAGDNYAGVSQTANFEVIQATNDWLTEPKIEGWNFGSQNNTDPIVKSNAKYGNNRVEYSYAAAIMDGDEAVEYDDLTKAQQDALVWVPNLPFNQGSYYLRGYIPADDNYTELYGYSVFTIGQGVNSWTTYPSVVTWAWNGYDKTVNIFSGAARSNKPAQYSILVKDSNSEGGHRALTVGDFIAADGTIVNDSDTVKAYVDMLTEFTLVGDDNGSKLVSDEIAEILAMLKPEQQYELYVEVASGENLAPLSQSVDFKVSKAVNSIATRPNIVSYNYGADIDLTLGSMTYGGEDNVRYKVTGTVNIDGENTAPYESENKAMTADELSACLAGLGAGSYVLHAWDIAAATATYTALYGPNHTLSIVFNVSRAANGWTSEPQESIGSKLYSAVQSYTAEEFAAWFAGLEANSGTDVSYAILTTGFSTVIEGPLTYDQLYTKLMAAIAKADSEEELKTRLAPGSYVIRATVAQSANYGSIYTNISFELKRESNTVNKVEVEGEDEKLVALPTEFTGSWGQAADGESNDSTLDAFELKAVNGDVVYTLAGVPYTYAALVEYVKELNAGTYQVTVSVASTYEYDGFTAVIPLRIKAGSNSWEEKGETENWSIGSTITVIGDTEATAAETVSASVDWVWGSTIAWSGTTPIYGNLVYVEIRDNNAATGSSALHYITVDYNNNNGRDAINNISKALEGLNVGEYTMKITAPAGTNWEELSDSIGITVTKAGNGWTTTPALIRNGVSVTSWQFSLTDMGKPTAAAKHGEVEYRVYKLNTDSNKYEPIYDAASFITDMSGMPTGGGQFKIVFFVNKPSPVNYDGVDDYDITFTITKNTNERIDLTVPNYWYWGSYNRTEDLFVADPESKGDVSFAILDSDNNVVKVTDADGNEVEIKSFVLENDYVSKDVADLLNLLTAGTYKLKVHVDETEEFGEFDVERQITVRTANNGWVTAPRVKPWALNNWTESDNTPVAQPIYGTAKIIIRMANNHDFVICEATQAYNQLKPVGVKGKDMFEAPAGMYELVASVEGLDGCYGEIKEQVFFEFNIYPVSIEHMNNYWSVSPTIADWTANVDGVYSKPVGEPLRGATYFTVYKRVERAGGGYEVGEEITEKNGILVKPDENERVAAAYYLPLEPGLYYLAARSEYIYNGEHIENDDLELDSEHYVRFEVFPRENRFTNDPVIADVLELSNRGKWAEPEATVLVGEIEYSYQLTGKRDANGNIIPVTDSPIIKDKKVNDLTEPGIYSLIAVSKALYALDVPKTKTFEIVLSANSWEDAPTIKDWQEGEIASDPTGRAKVGSENIVYTYARADAPDVILKGKPLTEGSYILYAKLELEGYETLTARYEFTIGSEYSQELVILNLVFGVIACLLAGVVITFAIRRYKENG